MVWYVLIGLGIACAGGLLYFGFAKEAASYEGFRLKHLVTGRRSIEQSSRKQLLIEGDFLLGLSLVALLYKVIME